MKISLVRHSIYLIIILTAQFVAAIYGQKMPSAGDDGIYQDEVEKSLKLLQQATTNPKDEISRDPVFQKAWRNYFARKYKNAIQNLLVVEKKYPEDYGLKFAIGMVFTLTKDYPAGESYLLKAMAKKPNDPYVYFYLGIHYRFAGNDQKANQYFIGAYRMNKDIDFFWGMAALALFQNDEKAEFAALLHRGLSKMPDRKDFWYLEAMRLVFHDKLRDKEMIDQCIRGLSSFYKNTKPPAGVNMMLGILTLGRDRQGDNFLALAHFETALQQAPKIDYYYDQVIELSWNLKRDESLANACSLLLKHHVNVLNLKKANVGKCFWNYHDQKQIERIVVFFEYTQKFGFTPLCDDFGIVAAAYNQPGNDVRLKAILKDAIRACNGTVKQEKYEALLKRFE